MSVRVRIGGVGVHTRLLVFVGVCTGHLEVRTYTSLVLASGQVLLVAVGVRTKHLVVVEGIFSGGTSPESFSCFSGVRDGHLVL